MGALTLQTSDGHTLAADLTEPAGPPRGGVAVCHPHPLYGGNRFHPIVDAVFRAAPAVGLRAVRFDFRADHADGDGERHDVVAALDAVALDDLPVFVVGYSFGAVVALSTRDPRISGLVAVAPPLAAASPRPACPTLVLTPRHDQFCPPDAAEPIVRQWPDATFEVIESADHFLAGFAAVVADRAIAWLAR